MPLSSPVTAAAIECSAGPLGRAAAVAVQGVRNNFEDAHVLDQGLSVCAVYDGHLGDAAAAFCKERLHLHALAGPAAPETLQEAFRACDEELHNTLPEGSEAGSTAVLAMVQEDASPNALKVLVANCGDSRAVLWRKSSDTIEATRDHRPDGPDEQRRIEAAGGFVSDDARIDGQLACSRAFGAFKFKQGSGSPAEQKVTHVPEIYEWRAQRGDWLILACDGVWDTFSSERIVQEVCKAETSDLGDTVAKTLQLCIDKEADDNLTLLAVELGAVAEEASTVRMTPGNFLKTKDKEVLEQYASFCLRFGYSLTKEMRPKAPPTAALTETEAVPGLPRFPGLPMPTPKPAAQASDTAVTSSALTNGVPKEPSRGSFTPLVVVGPSGVGKGTLIGHLLKGFPERFGFSVSHTTRKARPGEKDGHDYHFVDEETMKKELQTRGKFIEHATVHGNIYGTSQAAVDAVQRTGKICILDIDVQGAQQLKELHPEFKFLFIAPPSLELLEKRLRGRGTETEEKVQVRLSNAKKELEFCENNKDFFEHILINGDLGLSVAELKATVREWYPELVQVVKVTNKRSPAFFIRAARELIADRKQLQSSHPAEVKVVGLGNALPATAAVAAALEADGHEVVCFNTDLLEVVTSSSNRQTQMPHMQVILRIASAKQ
eukprot:TRINITY_DN97430_c0_g1_i1.p1 TRINITY_DN97430_c0_g1~~TRINITY_DN97430_c0_g1_i1.p1  ORF type:complete len:662 (+),score=162.49 TRINITY_DN97430_c0_g1_i1:16-2001(+)